MTLTPEQVTRIEQLMQPADTWEWYNQWLDEHNKNVLIKTPQNDSGETYYPSEILPKIDNKKYVAGYTYFIASLKNVVTINGKYYREADIKLFLGI